MYSVAILKESINTASHNNLVNTVVLGEALLATRASGMYPLMFLS
jgi:hypothetical protein